MSFYGTVKELRVVIPEQTQPTGEGILSLISPVMSPLVGSEPVVIGAPVKYNLSPRLSSPAQRLYSPNPLQLSWMIDQAQADARLIADLQLIDGPFDPDSSDLEQFKMELAAADVIAVEEPVQGTGPRADATTVAAEVVNMELASDAASKEDETPAVAVNLEVVPERDLLTISYIGNLFSHCKLDPETYFQQSYPQTKAAIVKALASLDELSDAKKIHQLATAQLKRSASEKRLIPELLSHTLQTIYRHSAIRIFELKKEFNIIKNNCRKIVRYSSRKRFADIRPRVGGRFVKIPESDELGADQLKYGPVTKEPKHSAMECGFFAAAGGATPASPATAPAACASDLAAPPIFLDAQILGLNG